MIFTLTDRQYNVLDVVESRVYLIGQYVDSITETLDLTISTLSANSELWTEGCYIMCQDNNGDNHWFTVYAMQDGFNETTKDLTCYGGSLDLVAEDALPISAPSAQPFTWYFDKIFFDTGVVLGVNELAGMTRKLEYTSSDVSNAVMLQYILNGFDKAEAAFQVEFVGSIPNKLILNVYKKRGLTDPQVLFTDMDDTLVSLTRTRDITELGTCLRLTSSGTSDSGTTAADITLVGKYYEEKDSKGTILYYSPKASDKIFSPLARQNYYVSLPGKEDTEATGYINRSFSSSANSPDELWQSGLAELKRIDHTIVTYEVKGKAYDCHIGDAITITATTMKPPVMISARVVEYKFNDDDSSKNEYTLSNYVELQSDMGSADLAIADIKKSLGEIIAQTKTFATVESVTKVADDVASVGKVVDTVTVQVGDIHEGLTDLEEVAVHKDTVDLLHTELSKSIADQATQAQEALDAAKATLQTAADTANKNAEARHAAYLEETAATAKLIEAAQADATTAISKGEDALKAADGVSTKVTQQAALITAAQTAADNASKKAISVELTAEGLAKTIASVKTTADGAMTASHTAQETADGLATTIATVKTTAEGAVETANTAKTTADGMVTTLTSTTETAKNAASAASTANTQITTINQTLKEYGVSMADMMTKTDFKVENGKITIAIQDAKDYATGEIAKVEVHTAYAWSADVTDRFTTVYPGENLVLKSALSTDGDDSVKPTHVDGKWILTDAKSVWPTIPDIYTRLDSSKKYSFSFKIKKTAGVIRGLGGHSLIFETGSQQIYLDGVLQSVTSWSVANIEIDDNLTHTIQVVARIVPNLTGDNRLYIQIGRRGGYADIYSAEIWDLKVEEGQVATVYTPAPTEDPSNAYPHYVGTSLKGSDNPADYTWQLDPAYLSIMSEMALQGKLDNDSFYEALDGKVNVEDFLETQQLADTLKDTINAFIQETFANAIADLEQRDVGLAAELGSRVAEFSFLKTYMKMGEEGFVIGSDDSRMKMLLGNGKLSFIDGGDTVAYFSNQSLYINRGIIVDGMQVNTHKWVRLNDEHTIFAYVGG